MVVVDAYEYSASVFDRSLLASLRIGFACFGRHKPQRRKMSLEIDIGMDSSATAPTGLTVEWHLILSQVIGPK
jgi:hypothetical protein